jgi:hypothetical protein
MSLEVKTINVFIKLAKCNNFLNINLQNVTGELIFQRQFKLQKSFSSFSNISNVKYPLTL